jgi:hypothetical protein
MASIGPGPSPFLEDLAVKRVASYSVGKAGDEKSRAECRQEKRDTKQDARDAARDIKK